MFLERDIYFQAFQFNSKYLIAIHDHVYSCQFGTFIGKKFSKSIKMFYIILLRKLSKRKAGAEAK